MFPLSFSSSSSLSSIPPSLDSISELDHVLSDISEDEDRIDDVDSAHTLWTLPSNTLSLFTDQQLADLEQLAQNPSSSQTCSSEILKSVESCQAQTRATAGLLNWRSWFSLKGVVKYVSFVFGFLSVSGNGNMCLATGAFSRLMKKLHLFSPALFMMMSKWVPKLNIYTITAWNYRVSNMIMSKLDQILNILTFRWTHLVAFLTQHLPPKISNTVAALCSRPAQLSLPNISSLHPSILSTIASLSSLPARPFSFPSCGSLPAFSCSNLIASVHRYLLNPSPLFLPCLLVVFLLAVMLTASQSVVLALILATPLGLTLCYLEKVVSSQRKTALPVFLDDGPDDQSENQLSSVFNRQASPLTPTHTPPRIRHRTNTEATWMQEMCDPAA